MLLSWCIPAHNRTADLKKAMPYVLEAAGVSPPVEVVVVDYNSPDDLEQYMRAVMAMPVGEGVSITYRKYTGREYYHMAHARNLSVLAAHGEYICISSCDIYPEPDYFQVVRQYLSDGDYDWMHGECFRGAMVIRRQTFIDAGGYDERIEFYGPEDRDLEMRLYRRGCVFKQLPPMLHVIRTPNDEKVKNYRLALTKMQMAEIGHRIYEENMQNRVLVANPDGWGRWDTPLSS